MSFLADGEYLLPDYTTAEDNVFLVEADQELPEIARPMQPAPLGDAATLSET